MIISHQHRFIFLKTSKTAGTSVEIALSEYCGAGDILAPLWGPDEELRRTAGYRTAQRYRAPVWEYRPRDIGRSLRNRRLKARFYNHMPAADVRARVDAAIWDGYFKFAFDRNPWDRMVSSYYWRHPGTHRPDFATFLERGAPARLKRRGWGVYTIDDEPVVDRLYRYEEMDLAIADIALRIGLPSPLHLPQTKAHLRPVRLHYSALYGPEKRQLVADTFADEIALNGYRFETVTGDPERPGALPAPA